MVNIKIFGIAAVVFGSLAGAAQSDTFNIEIDYMSGAGHSHRPSAAVIAAVQRAFACQGHTLNIDVDDAIPHVNTLVRDPDNCGASLFGYDNNTNSSFGQIRQTYFDHEGQAGWYYGVFAHRYQNRSCSTTGSSGLSNGGKFFIVTMGGFSGGVGTPFDNAATLMHEFGHNLGLSHCGTQNCGSQTGAADYVGPYVVNMPSTMSYQYQLAGVDTNLQCQDVSLPESLFKDIDYSHGRMCAFNENDLDENVGSAMRSVDWDCDGTLEVSVAQNTNNSSSGWCGAGGNTTFVADYNEWANLSPGARLARAGKTGDYRDLEAGGYRFVDPDDVEAVKGVARELLVSNNHPEMIDELLAVVQNGNIDLLSGTRVLTIDRGDTEGVKRVALAELDRRRVEFDEFPCISAEERERAMSQRGACAQPTLTTEACHTGKNVYLGPTFFVTTGSCVFPYASVQAAHDNNPSRSRFYLKPRTYDAPSTVILNKSGVWTCERTGSAVIK